MTTTELLIVYVLLLVPIAAMVRYRIPAVRELLVSVVRMTIQLALVGLYLRLLFRLDQPLVTFAWIVVMLFVADFNILKKSKLPRHLGVVGPMFAATAVGIAVPLIILLVAVRPEPWFTARYAVPLTGMVLGNSLRGNIIALDTFRDVLSRERDLYATRLFCGATHREALRPVIALSLEKSLAPTIAATATMGLVSLPGMMTGQLLGGAVPMTAIRYQIAIMLAILAAVALAALLNVVIAGRIFFDRFEMPEFEAPRRRTRVSTNDPPR